MNKKHLNLTELSEYTGISKSYLYKLTHLGKIPYSKPFGKLIFFSKESVDNWLLSNQNTLTDAQDTAAATYVTLNTKGKGGLTK